LLLSQFRFHLSNRFFCEKKIDLTKVARGAGGGQILRGYMRIEVDINVLKRLITTARLNHGGFRLNL
jgi:hypothetical protein